MNCCKASRGLFRRRTAFALAVSLLGLSLSLPLAFADRPTLNGQLLVGLVLLWVGAVVGWQGHRRYFKHLAGHVSR